MKKIANIIEQQITDLAGTTKELIETKCFDEVRENLGVICAATSVLVQMKKEGLE